MTFHAVKLADDAPGMLGRAGRFLFDNHPLPQFQPPDVRPYQPGWFAKNILRAQPHSGYTPPVASGYGPGFLNGAKTVGHAAGDMIRGGVLGSPIAVDRDLKAKGYMGMAKDFYNIRKPQGWQGAAATAMSLATPAIDTYRAITGDPNRRGENIGGAIAGAAIAPITSRLGLPGVFVQQPVQQFGRWLGSKFDGQQQPIQPAGLPPPVPPQPAEPQPNKVASIDGLVQFAQKNPVSTAVLAGAAYAGTKKLLQPKPKTPVSPTTLQT